MEITEEQDKRMSESRRRLMRAFYVALGSYIEQEAKKLDQWRDELFGQNYGHLSHEVKEIGRSKSRAAQIHNCMDSAMLSLIMLDKVLEEDSGEIDIDILYTGKPSLQMQKVLGVVSDMERITGVVKDEDLFNTLMEDHGISRAEATRNIYALMRDGMIYSPRPGYYKRT